MYWMAIMYALLYCILYIAILHVLCYFIAIFHVIRYCINIAILHVCNNQYIARTAITDRQQQRMQLHCNTACMANSGNMEYVMDLPGICPGFAWDLPGIFLRFAQDLQGICPGFA